MSQIFEPIGNGILLFDCMIWSNVKQRRASISIRTNVASNTALNNALRDAGLGEWRVSRWTLFVGGDDRGFGRSAAIAANQLWLGHLCPTNKPLSRAAKK
ncbi:hypothetical protein ACQ4M4_27405 [Leptolyngbya sp. AN02str]|uniref:hypothetical protein n=1 Tax=Leptolyngbya sp. AN02str TaxID=3423363 RepID=UPI003D30FC4F